jgi:hypothetical protein
MRAHFETPILERKQSELLGREMIETHDGINSICSYGGTIQDAVDVCEVYRAAQSLKDRFGVLHRGDHALVE